MDYVKRLHNYFHKYPELSGEEIRTSRKIKEELEKSNIPYESVGNYGIIGSLKGKNSGKTIALRADIDALPITESENNLVGKKDVISNTDGVCHACGHDGHTAMLLASARELSEMRANFDGTILFCFEEGEEDGSGIDAMLEKLEDRKINAVWGIHLYSGLETGKVSVDEGARMSGVHFFDVEVKGKSGHGSSPHQTIDPINCTVQILSNLFSLVSREINPLSTAVLTVGKLNAGSAPNIIPEKASFEGTIRYFERNVSEKLVKAFYNTVEDISKAHGCKVKISMKQPAIPVINDRELSQLAKESVKESIGEEYLTSCDPWMASESMGYYLDKYPGVFAHLGIANKKLGTGASHHNPEFDIDDNSLINGVSITIRFALDFLSDK